MRWFRWFVVLFVVPLAFIAERMLKWTAIIVSIPILGCAGAVLLIGTPALLLGVPLGLLGVWAGSPDAWPWLIGCLKWGGGALAVGMVGGAIGGFYGASRAIIIQRFHDWWERSRPNTTTDHGS